MDPINYTAMMPQTDFLGSVQGGMNFTNQIRAAQLQRQQQQLQLQRAQQYQADAQTAMKDPTPQAFASLALKYPEHREAFKQSWDTLNADQQQTELKDGADLAATLHSGRPDLAEQKLQDRITAVKNSGKPTAQYEKLLDLVKTNPQQAYAHTMGVLAGLPGGDKVLKNLGDINTAPATERKAIADANKSESDATKAAVAAKFAESDAAIDLQKKGWDITKIQEDIKIARQNAAIAAANVAVARDSNGIKRQENQLKLADLVQKRDDAVRSKVADLESARSNMDNMLNTADRILKTPKDVVGSAAGPVSSRMPTMSQDTADFEALVETLGSQSFMAQIPNIKGMGALSNAEGEKLQAALQNFSLKQSPERLLENVREAQRLVMKARKNMAARSGLPESIPDTPAVSTSGADIDALVKKYAGGN
jgi:hypothetical protein